MNQVRATKKGRTDSFNFGKHKGKTVAEVIEEDPKYICWVYENVAVFPIERDIYLECSDIVESESE